MTWACCYCTYEQEDGNSTSCELCGMPGKREKLKSTTTATSSSSSSTSSSSSIDEGSIVKSRRKKEQSVIDLTTTTSTTTSSNSNSNSTSTSSRKRKIPSTNSDAGVVKNRNSYSSINNKTKRPDNDSDAESDRTQLKPQRQQQQKQQQQQQQQQTQRQSTLSFSSTNSNANANANATDNTNLPQHGHTFAHKVVSSSVFSRANDSKYNEVEVQEVLERVFKLQSLRHLQPKSIKCTMEGKSQMIVMATGGGKSLCYQLPACILGGVTIVISPLLALMKDQTEALNMKGIPAACINSSQTEKQNKEILERLVPSLYPKSGSSSNRKKKGPTNCTQEQPTVLLYITPESIQTERMRAVLKTLYKESRLAMFAVDEAHCLSSWGHDFRSSYRKLNYLRTTFPNTICMALTATATPKVIQDITNELSLQNCPLHVGSFDRPNIYYKVKYKDALEDPLGNLVKYVVDRHTAHAAATAANNKNGGKKTQASEECSGIVYVHKREETTMIARAISKAGISARAYHGGLKKNERIDVQDGWSNGTIQVAVATVAFGMGIDRHCVRYVVHWCLPKTIEGFYQEAGRAGRDGQASHSLLYYSPDDVGKFKYLIRMQSNSSKNNNVNAAEKNMERKLEQLEEMQEYCTQMKCRRNTLIGHFGGSKIDCKSTCDVCANPKKVERIMQASTAIKDVRRQQQSFGGGGGKRGKKVEPWNGQWNKAHGDDEDAIANDWGDSCLMAGDLRVTGPLGADPEDHYSSDMKGKSGFRRASDILSKYESMEGKEYRYGNDDSGLYGVEQPLHASRAKNSINIPEHLRASLKAASDFTTANNVHQTKKKVIKTLSSVDHAMNAKGIQEKLDRIKAEREDRLKSLQEKSMKKPPPPPPPPLSFSRRKR